VEFRGALNSSNRWSSRTLDVGAGDPARELDESFFLDLTQPVDAVISTPTVKGTIKNDDKR
jgi:hypothetical protein